MNQIESFSVWNKKILAWAIEILKRFSFECRNTKTKVITLTNHNTRKQRNEPIRIRSECM